jgi:hypothetical protein
MATTSSQKSYLERLNETKDQREQAIKEQDAKDADMQNRLDLHKAQKNLSDATRLVESAKNTVPYSSDRIIDAQEQLEQAAKEVALLQSIRTELFPESED